MSVMAGLMQGHSIRILPQEYPSKPYVLPLLLPKYPLSDPFDGHFEECLRDKRSKTPLEPEHEHNESDHGPTANVKLRHLHYYYI